MSGQPSSRTAAPPSSAAGVCSLIGTFYAALFKGDDLKERGSMDAVIFIFSILIGLGLYFAPTIVAQTRNIKHVAIVFSINLIFGWTVVAWVAALIWAVRQRPALDGDPASPYAVQGDVWIFDPPRLSEPNVVEQGDHWVFGPDPFLQSPRDR